MSLIDGLVLHTMDKANKVSQHSMLMRFYQLDDEIHERYQTVAKPFHDLPLYMMEIEARTILKALNIL